MKRRSNLFFTLILIPVDLAMIVLAGISVYYLRFANMVIGIRPIMFDLPFPYYLKVLLIISILWIVVFAFSGLYEVKGSRRLGKELRKIFIGCSLGLMLIVFLIFFRRELFNSRFIVLFGWFISIIYVSLGRLLVSWLRMSLYKRGQGVKKVIIVGGGKTADILVSEFFKKKSLGFKVIKRIKEINSDVWLELNNFLKENEVDEIIQADPNLSKIDVLKLYDLSSEKHLTFRYAADLLGIKVLKTEVMEISGIPVVEVKRTTLDGWGKVAKRIFDIVISGLIIILLFPLLIFTAVMIKLDSRGPVFFSRKDDGSFVYRIGEGAKPFRYFKFRSMIPSSDSMRYNELSDRNMRGDGPMVKIKDDPRVTRFGKFIRRFSIDELPELFLVFIGRMSLVGPRPHLPEEVAKYEHHHKKTLTIKPGITGLAQTSGRSDLLFEEEVKLDVYYIENWSLLLDLNILLRTPWAVLKQRETL